MIIDVFYHTRSPEIVNAFERCVNAYNQWRIQTLHVCQRLGFVEFSGPDFCVPDYYLRSHLEHIQKIPGFRLMKDGALLAEHDQIPYSLRLDHPAGDHAYRELILLADDALNSLGVNREDYGMPGVVGYQRAACLMLGIDRQVSNGAFVAFSQVWAVSDQAGNFSLICSIPVTSLESSLAYDLPNMAEGWTDISAQQVIQLFNFHNSIATKE